MNARELYAYDLWPSRKGEGWHQGTAPGPSRYANQDFHVDLGCGTIPKGRIGVDRFAHPNVAVVAQFGGAHGATTRMVPAAPGGPAQQPVGKLNNAGLPFDDDSIRSIISHHCFEHVGEGFIQLIEECWRVLEPGGLLYAITPFFPSTSAVEDPDHVRYFQAYHKGEGTHSTWDAFCPEDGGEMTSAAFSVPYTSARFKRLELDWTPRPMLAEPWGADDHRELRVALEVIK